MLRIMTFALCMLIAGTAVAKRPFTPGMTCRQAQTLLGSQGAVVMSTGQHTYERFVISGRFCEVAEWAYTAYAPTKDARNCPLGYVCKSTPPLEYDRPGDHWFFDR